MAASLATVPSPAQATTGALHLDLAPARAASAAQSKAGRLPTGLPDVAAFAPRLGGVGLEAAQAPVLELAALGGAGAAAKADGGGLDAPKVSGLAWRSGASCGHTGLADWRGRSLDANVGFVQHDSWDRMHKYLRGGYFRAVLDRAPLAVVSLPMMPRSERRQHAACAAGKFDATFREFGDLLVRAGGGRAIVRLGWEAGIGSDSHPWGIDSTGDIPNYKKCFQRLAKSLKSTAPGIKIEWTNARKGGLNVNVMESYPGDEYVDVIGVHYYDNRPKTSSESVWNAMYNATINGGPMGLGRWLATAKEKGRKLAVPEWGLWQIPGESRTSADNAVYIDMMHRFFRANADSIAYENYYNCKDHHQIYPGNNYPRASSRYKALWGGGR